MPSAPPDLERYMPELRGRISYENRHRYSVCRDYVVGKRVLDIACGEGYGAGMLARKAKRVVGVDIDPLVIEAAKATYGADAKIEFRVGDCIALPFADASFDVVVSLETIEHIDAQDAFVAEAHRVLAPGGLMIVSTPNRVVYSEETGFRNVFHKREMDEGEFRTLLSGRFKHVEILAQRFYLPSIIAAPGEKAQPTYKAYVRREDGGTPVSADTVRPRAPVYFLAFCSDTRLSRPPAASVYIDESDDLWLEQERVLRWASGLHEEDEVLRARLREAEARVAQLQSDLDAAATPGAALDLHALLHDLKSAAEGTQTLLQTEARNLRKALDDAREKIVSLDFERRESGHVLRGLRRELDQAIAREEAAVKDAAARRAEAEHVAAQIVASEQALAAERNAGQVLDARLEEVRAHLHRAEDRISQLAGQVQQLLREREIARLETARLRDALEASAATVREGKARADRLAVERDEHTNALNTAIRLAVAEKQKLQEELHSLQIAAEDGEQERLRLQAALDTSIDTLQTSERQNELLREEKQAAEAEAARLITTLAATETQAAADIASLRSQIEDHRRVLSQARDEGRRLDAALSEAQAEVAAYAHREAIQAQERQTQERRAQALHAKRRVERELATASRNIRGRVRPLPFGLAFTNGSQLRPPFPIVAAPPGRLRRERRAIETSGFFDAAWYRTANPDVAASGMEPLAHFLRHGMAEDRDPHPLFSSGWFRATSGEAYQRAPALLTYLGLKGEDDEDKRPAPHPLFDPVFYLRRNEDVARSGMDPLRHFLAYGAAERRNPHPLIWMERLAGSPGLSDTSNPLIAYLTTPAFFGASPHPLFDGKFYLTENADVARAGINPLMHYCVIGWREGRLPHPLFATDWYLDKNADVIAAGANPLQHFVSYGAYEQRAPHPLFDIGYYLGRYRDARKVPYDALTHFILTGAQEDRETTSQLSVELIREVLPPNTPREQGLLRAFLTSPDLDAGAPTRRHSTGWPPAPEPNYWLPQALRDHIVDRYGENSVGLYLYLMSVVERFGDTPDAFADSQDLATLRARLAQRAVSRPKAQTCGPDASIIIPVYNNLVFTLTCVLSIVETASRFTYEIIIGDDRSTDMTEAVFAAAGNPVTLLRHDENLGFLGNCNTCAEAASGRVLIFLNNDTLTLPGWLDELMEPIVTATDVGFVGSKLLNADGTLQEAGGIYWRDGSAWNFGRGDNPRLPQYNYRKDVDYVSGASIAIPNDLWRELGGFDRAFAPAYCEDSDLAFRVRRAGWRSLYAPHSEVVHHEGKSHGRDTGSGIKAYQLINQAKFVARWRDTLEEDHFDNATNVFLARDRSRNKPHVLFVDHYVPQWDRDAGSRAAYHLMRMLAEAGFHVTLWPDNLNEDRAYCVPLQKMGIEVIYSESYRDGFESWFAQNGTAFDYAVVSRPHIAIDYYEAIRASSSCTILYYGHDIHYLRMELAREIAGDRSPRLLRELENMRAEELANWRAADVVLYFSAAERDVVRAADLPCRAEQIPLYGFSAAEIDAATACLAHFDARASEELLFVGGAHPPNVDALQWFATEVLPLVLRRNPKTKLNVVGAATHPDIAALASDAVVLHGRLSDAELTTLYARVGVAVVPLRYGGGVKGKMIEAMLHATPIVATPVGMQGLEPTEPLAFVASDAESFAAAVLAAQQSPNQARRHVEAGLAFVAQFYSKAALLRALAAVMPELSAAPAAAPEEIEA
jgi:GT2 family glycosyltransferase/SAM-dependent methyltransferase